MSLYLSEVHFETTTAAILAAGSRICTRFCRRSCFVACHMMIVILNEANPGAPGRPSYVPSGAMLTSLSAQMLRFVQHDNPRMS